MADMVVNKLPTVYDVAVHIFSHATQPESAKMNEVANQYVKTLADVWQKSFGSKQTLSIHATKYRLMKVVKDYHKEVYIKAHRTTKKHTNDKSSRESLWKLEELEREK